MSGSRVKIRRRYRTDWFRILTDLQYTGYSHARVAELVEVPLPTLHGWKRGSEPAHNYGHALLELWTEVTGLPLSSRPMTFE